jgi:hypothetical protein
MEQLPNLDFFKGGASKKINQHSHPRLPKFFLKECLHINQLLGICHIMLLPYIQKALEAKSPAGEQKLAPSRAAQGPVGQIQKATTKRARVGVKFFFEKRPHLGASLGAAKYQFQIPMVKSP